MGVHLVPLATKGALESGIVLKFSYDEEKTDCPLSIQSLSIVDQVRLFYHPHDRDNVLMARVQYPFQDVDGKTYYITICQIPGRAHGGVRASICLSQHPGK